MVLAILTVDTDVIADSCEDGSLGAKKKAEAIAPTCPLSNADGLLALTRRLSNADDIELTD